MNFKCYSSEELITLNTLTRLSPPGTHFTAESTEAMRIKSLVQGENILMLGIEPSTFVSKIDILTTTPIVHNFFLLKGGKNHVLRNVRCTKYLVCATTVTAVLHHCMSPIRCKKKPSPLATLAPPHTPCLFSMDMHTVRENSVIARFLLILLLSGTIDDVRCAPSP